VNFIQRNADNSIAKMWAPPIVIGEEWDQGYARGQIFAKEYIQAMKVGDTTPGVLVQISKSMSSYGPIEVGFWNHIALSL
jgi:hypothetical protein